MHTETIAVDSVAVSDAQDKPSSTHVVGHFVTIDSASTRDVDDAIAVVATESEYRVTVCIADPTSLVLAGSTEDENARLLGASVYVRDATVRKMLPRRISEIEGSLHEGKSRKVFVFDAVLDRNLEALSFDVSRRRVKVAKRLAFDEIQQILDNPDDDSHPTLVAARGLAYSLLQRRRRTGAMVLYDLSRLIFMDDEGRMRQFERREEVVGYVIVQELMVLTNTLVANWMVTHDIPTVFRNHQAKTAAPVSSELLDTVETWLANDTMDLGAAKTTFDLLMGKALYGATARGHFALTLPFYLHITSPLRRYADLVNLRQVRAFLDHQDLPYDQGALEALADQLNTAAEHRKEERSNGFKSVVMAHATQALENGDLTHLADHELSQAIKLGASQPTLPLLLVDELARRLDESIVTEKILDRLLATVPAGTWPGRLLTALTKWLHRYPARAVSLLMYARDAQLVDSLEIESDGEGVAFVASVRLLRTGQEPLALSASGSRKRDAEQAACVRAVIHLVGGADDAARPDVARSAPRGNPKGRLLELCQKKNLPAPAIHCIGRGPSHAMRFTATLTMTYDGEPIQLEAEDAGTKKETEAIVCSLALDRIKSLRNPGSASIPPAPAALSPAIPVSAPVAAPAVARVATVNAIGLLLELSQQERCAPPHYVSVDLLQTPPRFRTSVHVFGRAAGVFRAEAGRKQDAKALVALQAWEAWLAKSGRAT